MGGESSGSSVRLFAAGATVPRAGGYASHQGMEEPRRAVHDRATRSSPNCLRRPPTPTVRRAGWTEIACTQTIATGPERGSPAPRGSAAARRPIRHAREPCKPLGRSAWTILLPAACTPHLRPAGVVDDRATHPEHRGGAPEMFPAPFPGTTTSPPPTTPRPMDRGQDRSPAPRRPCADRCLGLYDQRDPEPLDQRGHAQTPR